MNRSRSIQVIVWGGALAAYAILVVVTWGAPRPGWLAAIFVGAFFASAALELLLSEHAGILDRLSTLAVGSIALAALATATAYLGVLI